MTPVGGKDSAPQVNLGWGLLNLAGGLALVAITARTGEQRWDRRLVAFDAGAATFAAWMAGSEALLEVNTSDGDP